MACWRPCFASTIRNWTDAALADPLLCHAWFCHAWLCHAAGWGCARDRPNGRAEAPRHRQSAARPAPPPLQGPHHHRLWRPAAARRSRARPRRPDLDPDHAAAAGLLDIARLLRPPLRLLLPGRLLRRWRLSPLLLPRALCVWGNGVLLSQ